MKNIFYILLVSLFYATFSCNKASEPYSFFRATNPQNFVTAKGGELYAYTANDSVLIRADYFVKILAQVKTYGSKVLHYGHCWSVNYTQPKLTTGCSWTTDPDIVTSSTDTFSFASNITKLEAETPYYIRSYVITEDGGGNAVDTGYNPVVIKVTTKSAIDEWFYKDGLIGTDRPGGMRYDALGFNLGDTIFFGAGKDAKTFMLTDMSMYNPQTGVWSTMNVLGPIKYNSSRPEAIGDGFADGIGFGITYKVSTDPITRGPRRCIYIGLGDYVGNDVYTEKSDIFREYDFTSGENQWVVMDDYPFDGIARSNAVCFVINDHAYIGTGKSQLPLYDWWAFRPAYLHDNNPKTLPWVQMTKVPSLTGRTGAIAFAINGRGYFGLGYNANGEFLRDFYRFEPDKAHPEIGSWNAVTPFPGEPRANAVAFVIGSQAYVGTGDNIVGDVEGTYTGQIFGDFWRYDPYDDKWEQCRNFTSNKSDRKDTLQRVTRAVGFSLQSENIGFAGFGVVPEPFPNPAPSHRAQDDLWYYRPYDKGAKK